ncbi:MAG: hypothetical protein FWG98_15040 [Candidatus Cloacimonetes bacterium]|nr:hypothetical protein [Candidatus Cloacimonadota bacterium]
MKNQIKSIFISFVILVNFITSLSAAWIEREPMQLVQPNGDRVSAFISGDEFHSWTHDAEGFTIVKDNLSGYYCWATVDNDELISTGFPINQYPARSVGLEPFLNISEEAYQEKRREWDESFQINRSFTPKTGEAHNLVIFITFPWGQNHDSDPLSDTYSGDGFFSDPFSVYEQHYRDLNTYFWDSSYQQLDVSSSFFPIQHGIDVESYEAPEERYYYTRKGAGNQQGTRVISLLRGAVAHIAPMVPLGLDIDKDNDGYVDNVTFIIEGRRDISESALWDRAWTFGDNGPIINGKKVRNYNIIIEENGYGNYLNFRLVVILHEFAHSLGADDLYHLDAPDWRFDPVGPWCIMARSSTIFSSISSIVKYRDLGWIDIPTIETSGSYTLNPLASQQDNVAFRINSPYSENQYFIVEYRRKVTGKFPDSNLSFWYDHEIAPNTTYPVEIPNPHGLIVYRVIDGDIETEQYRINAYRPDELGFPYGSLKAFFSIESGRTAINDQTNPPSFIYGADGQATALGGLNISNIGNANATISFDVTISEPIFETFVKPGYSHLPDHFDTIQEAINSVYPGGTVNIYPHPDGVYVGDDNRGFPNFSSKKIDLVGIDSVVIDCEGYDFLSK